MVSVKHYIAIMNQSFQKVISATLFLFFYMILSYLFTDFSFFIIKFLFRRQNLFKSAINYTFYSLL
ncbi:hypothetical protein EF87_17920 [Bacillus amyloliquefaciens]|nr:hypothetical protein EF87_17920 [Bacillus amyloliquefaciens]